MLKDNSAERDSQAIAMGISKSYRERQGRFYSLFDIQGVHFLQICLYDEILFLQGIYSILCAIAHSHPYNNNIIVQYNQK